MTIYNEAGWYNYIEVYRIVESEIYEQKSYSAKDNHFGGCVARGVVRYFEQSGSR